MRTTIDLPDALYRRTKATAAVRGSTMKDVIIQAIEREVGPHQKPKKIRSLKGLPVIHLKHGRKLDLSDFNFDDLLA